MTWHDWFELKMYDARLWLALVVVAVLVYVVARPFINRPR